MKFSMLQFKNWPLEAVVGVAEQNALLASCALVSSANKPSSPPLLAESQFLGPGPANIGIKLSLVTSSQQHTVPQLNTPI